jgi:TolB-like protein/Tfp pilus assembly protein PilF
VKRLLEPAPPLRQLRTAVPADVEDAVARALAREPGDRFQNGGEFAQALTLPSPAYGGAGSSPRARARIPPRQQFLAAVTVLLLVAAAWLVARHLAMHDGGGAGAQLQRPSSVAVLPFRSLGLDPQDEYLSDGITDDLINALGRVPELRVVARTSAFTFKGKAEDVRQVGRRLNVEAVVEGSLRRLGDTLRVTAQLVNVADGYQLWAERYERPSAQLLATEDDLSRAILGALRPRAAGAVTAHRAGRPTDDPEAYKLYLKGRYHLGKLTEEDFRKAVSYFDQAIGLDPTFASAYSGLADAYSFLSTTFLSPAEGMPKARAAVRRALELDPFLAEAHASLGNIQMWYEWDWRGAEQSLRRALELNPNYAATRLDYGKLLVFLGRLDEAAAQLNQARQLDPLSLNIEVTAVWPMLFGRRYNEAIDALDRTLKTDSSFLGAQFLVAQAYALKGEFGPAEARWQKVRTLMGNHPDVLGRLGNLYAAMGAREKAQAIADSLRASYHKGGADEAYALAVVYAGLGEKERALEWLDSAYRERSTWMNLAKVQPELDPLRAEPGFRDILRKLHLE